MSLVDARAERRPWWHEHWRGMPEYVQDDQEPHRTLEVRLRSDADLERFERLIRSRTSTRSCSPGVSWVWYPPIAPKNGEDALAPAGGKYIRRRAWVGGPNPRYPVYIISKGRWEKRFTSRFFERIGIPYRIVVEPQEYDKYAAVIDPAKILVLPFSNLGQGSIPARNWVWEHALASGAERHWIVDDNIKKLYRLNRNEKARAFTGAPLRVIEDWADRYENVALAGPHYKFFIAHRQEYPPLYLNTRIYSCILIRNDLPFRWRGRYNEDTDLSLQVLKAGYVTALFNAFLTDKVGTMTMKGGNTDELYAGDGRLQMARELQRRHPDVTTITRKWGRWQHHVDYRPFEKNELRLKPGVEIPEGVNEYGMRLEVEP